MHWRYVFSLIGMAVIIWLAWHFLSTPADRLENLAKVEHPAPSDKLQRLGLTDSNSNQNGGRLSLNRQVDSAENPISKEPDRVSSEALANLDAQELKEMILGGQRVEQAFNELLRRANEGDEGAAIGLMALQSQFSGESLQFLLKAVSQFPFLGGNDAILEAFLSNTDEPGIERIRMLSYLNPSSVLTHEELDDLIRVSREEDSLDVRQAIRDAIATAGGDAGVHWLLNELGSIESRDELIGAIDVLGQTGSREAFDHLHRLMNSHLQDPEINQHIRAAIMRIRPEL